MPQVDEFLKYMEHEGASDLHLVVHCPPIIREKGALIPIPNQVELTHENILSIIEEILDPHRYEILLETHDLDFAYEIPDLARYRVNILYQKNGVGMVFRRIPSTLPNFSDIHIPDRVMNFANTRSGLVLVTGPTGSGKSTTLACIIDQINRTRKGHILTIEDPIEFVHQSKNCLITQREVEVHTHSFSNALKSSLRQDPDVILVGEMRDRETISMALTAAEMGMLVFGTLHTNSAAKTINRIIDVFPTREKNQIRTMLASSLTGVIAQLLVLDSTEMKRIPVMESMYIDAGIRNIIREAKTHQISSLMESSANPDTQSMDQVLQELMLEGSITKEAAIKLASNKSRFEYEG